MIFHIGRPTCLMRPGAVVPKVVFDDTVKDELHV